MPTERDVWARISAPDIADAQPRQAVPPITYARVKLRWKWSFRAPSIAATRWKTFKGTANTLVDFSRARGGASGGTPCFQRDVPMPNLT